MRVDARQSSQAPCPRKSSISEDYEPDFPFEGVRGESRLVWNTRRGEHADTSLNDTPTLNANLVWLDGSRTDEDVVGPFARTGRRRPTPGLDDRLSGSQPRLDV